MLSSEPNDQRPVRQTKWRAAYRCTSNDGSGKCPASQDSTARKAIRRDDLVDDRQVRDGADDLESGNNLKERVDRKERTARHGGSSVREYGTRTPEKGE
jgi:hypothetical protein